MLRQEIIEIIEHCKEKQKQMKEMISHLKKLLKKYHRTDELKLNQKRYQSDYYLKRKKLKNDKIYNKPEGNITVCAIETENVYVEL